MTKPSSALMDSKALAWLHAKGRDNVLKLVLSQVEVYVSALSIYELLSAMSYYGLGDPKTLSGVMEKIYHILYPDREVIAMAASINADLMHKGVIHNDTDIIVVATALRHGLPLITADPDRYSIFKPYGLVVYRLDKLVKDLEEELQARIMEERVH
ncbi:MAG: PIN domain-containing protein [Desulfurococcales archaeon]|nr:PIN domain-containing protein [Desulfurococcales archaeon]